MREKEKQMINRPNREYRLDAHETPQGGEGEAESMNPVKTKTVLWLSYFQNLMT